jgi:hypothetical protein
VVTNNALVRNEYISHRLTKDLVQQHEAARPQKRTALGLNLKWL